MRVGLFGGSFDPVHAGHVALARTARRELALDRVLFLPTARPPHKPGRRLAPALARYTMVELALVHEEGLFTSAAEWTPDRPVYTVDTVAQFRAELPDAELFLLIGADSFGDLPLWVRWQELVASVELAVAVRPGWDLAALRASAAPELLSRIDGGHVHFLANQPLPISATAIRAALAAGEEPPRGSLPPLVLDYACKYALYR